MLDVQAIPEAERNPSNEVASKAGDLCQSAMTFANALELFTFAGSQIDAVGRPFG
jgi:hypothetical protein